VKGPAALCPACRAPAAADARFCSQCGSALAAAAAEEARRTVTALFADVVGSTPLAERLDPEDFRTVVGEAVSLMATAVEAFGGTVEHVAGDGLLALFGAPQAHEDDAERAVLAGLRLVDDISRRDGDIERERAIDPIAVRVGIETGLVIVGPLARVELTAMGDSVNTAARLQAQARPGTVLVGERTRRLVDAAFEWGERREFILKGKAGAVTAVEAVHHRERRRSRAATALVGRERELAAGLAALDEAAAGRGGVLAVLGEAGIGKSRLIAELRERWPHSAPAGALWLDARCVSYGRALPYLPFRQVLRDPGLVAEAGELAGALAPVTGTGSNELALDGGDPAGRRRRSFDAVRALLQGRSARGPVVLALDDAQWADPSSVALAEHLLPGLGRLPILLLVATRPEREGPGERLVGAARRVLGERMRELRLRPLGQDSDRLLLEELVGAVALPEGLERRVLARAEGNPFFLEELVRSLTDAGALGEGRGGLGLVSDVDVDLPDTVERLVLARIDRLPVATREVARAASVLGRQFAGGLLEAVAGPDVPAALLELERHDLVRSGGSDDYRFKHTLIQEAVYASLLRRRRELLHGRAALALEGLDPSRHGLLAHHWAAGGDDNRALTEYEHAAQGALAVYGLEEAAEHARLGLAAGERLGLEADDPRIRELFRVRGRVRLLSDDLAGAERDFDCALASARAAGDRRGELAALIDLALLRRQGLEGARRLMEEALSIAEALGDIEATVDVLSRRAIVDASGLRLDSALQRGERARALADSAGDERLLGKALDALKLVALMLGDLPALERLAGAAASIHKRLGDTLLLEYAVLESAFVPLGRGQFDQARARIEEALSINAELGDVSHRSLFLDALGWLERSRGDYDTAVEVGREAHELARRLAPPDFAAWSAASLGWTLLEAGRAGAAVEVLGDGLRLAESCEAAGQMLRCAGLLAAAQAELGERLRASAAAGLTERVMQGMRVPPEGAFVFGGHATLALATVRLGQGEVAKAQRLVAPLLHAAARGGWLETEAQAALVLGRCRRARGDARGADELHQRAVTLATEVGLPGVWRAAGSAAPHA
jgi:class 3 adenylate cyclase/tetratricopeptide (TPR) repeat protein